MSHIDKLLRFAKHDFKISKTEPLKPQLFSFYAEIMHFKESNMFFKCKKKQLSPDMSNIPRLRMSNSSPMTSFALPFVLNSKWSSEKKLISLKNCKNLLCNTFSKSLRKAAVEVGR